MSSNILFVFEGERTERKIAQSLERNVLPPRRIIKCIYAEDVYALYREIVADEDLDIFTLLMTRNVENEQALSGSCRNDFSEIYLFFDYDAHATMARRQTNEDGTITCGDAVIAEMLRFFDNETEHGKLYLSYPMVEALWHVLPDEQALVLTVRCKRDNCIDFSNCKKGKECANDPHYKTRVGQECVPQLSNLNSYTRAIWCQLLDVHLKRLHYLVAGTMGIPTQLISQLSIFEKQLADFISRSCPEVVVLNAFPVFVFDYFGAEATTRIFELNNVT